MKKHRILPLLCTAVLSVALMTGAWAAQGRYSDLTADHWAYEYMDKAAGLKLLLGMGDGRMAPDDALTWAQCLTLTARTFAPQQYAAAQGASWELVGYNACVEAGFILPQGEEFLDVTGDVGSLSRPISRQDVVVLLARAIPGEITGRHVAYDPVTWEPRTLVANETLADYYSPPQTHWASVDRLFDLEVVQGSPAKSWDGQDITLLGGAEILRRADGAALFVRALDKVDSVHQGEAKTITVHIVDNQGAAITGDLTVESAVGESVSFAVSDQLKALGAVHYYSPYPEDQFWAEGWEPTVSCVCGEYTLVYYPMNEMERSRQDFVDAVLRGELTYDDYWWQPFNRFEIGENDLKHYILFGDRNKRRYGSQNEAEWHQTTVTVPMWRINELGVKYGTQGSFPVNAALAEDVVNIFTEIYNDPEQFPIRDMCGYGWRGDSAKGEHNCGTAIDINPNENYQIRNGKVECGTLWKPGENPYSIEPTGSVVRIFAKYGWSWGGDAWATGSDDSTGYHDYMHFSYMGG